MAIPPKDSQAIREALTRFDQDLRSSEQWKNWEQNGTYKWAIIDDGRRYPVKQILSMATGLSKRSFSGGPEANTYLTSRGFNVSRIHQDSDTDIRGRIENILARYLQVRTTKPFGTDKELWSAFDGICHSLRTLPIVVSRPHLKVSWSVGKGNWARVPFISILDDRETNTPQRGVYCVFLFRADMSGVYLTFNQGVTEPKKGAAGGVPPARPTV